MAKITNKHKKIIKEYSRDLEKIIPINKVILFGSIARGKYNQDSDLDLIVLSDAFGKISFMKRLELLSRARGRKHVKMAMDILGYTPEEFKEMPKESVVLKEAARDGIVVYP